MSTTIHVVRPTDDWGGCGCRRPCADARRKAGSEALWMREVAWCSFGSDLLGFACDECVPNVVAMYHVGFRRSRTAVF